MVEVLEQADQCQQILIAEEGTSGSDAHKRIGRADIGPGGRQRVEVAIHQVEEDAILPPSVSVGYQGKLAPVERMEGVGDAERS